MRATAAPFGLALAALVTALPASAFETADGRIQLHGYYQMQLRGISADWSDQFDMTQWYNILNLELEIDLAPDGFEPLFDSASAYVRTEVRFDCIYYDGCGMISSMNTYGNDSRNLPERLSGGRQLLSGGSLAVSQSERDVFTGPPSQPAGGLTESHVETTLSGSTVYPSNDPGDLTQGGPFKTFADGSGWDRYNGQGPTLPEFNSSANPTLGEDLLRMDDPFPHIFDNDLISIHGTAINGLGGGGFGLPVTNLLPWRPRDWSDANALLVDKVNPYDDAQITSQTQAAYYNVAMYEQITLAFQDAGSLPTSPDYDWSPSQMTVGDEPTYFNTKLRQALQSYDMSDPYATPPTFAEQSQRLADWKAAAQTASTSGPTGIGALPLRPMPCKNAVGHCVPDSVSATGDNAAQGIYLPSKALRNALDTGKVKAKDFRKIFKHNQLSRAFNHGWSQSRTYELKEAYLDLETFDSRLWLRLGKQNIVWGKTELFRTTDQFNPQDLSLASLPSLEESRIPLLAFRGVYSLYNIGPLEDVRFEVAINFDEFQGLDFGTCGEPYAPSIVCSVGTGALAHGTTGIGVVGVELPPAPWEDIQGLQGGARLEFRHDRFSFALSDYYGYSALPHINTLTEYDRNVDPETGRMRTVGSLGSCIDGNDPACLQAGPTHFDNDDYYNPRPVVYPDFFRSYLNGNNVDRLTDEPRNALEAHPVNQQVYAFACALTIGTVRVGTGGTCATSLFNDPQQVQGFPVGQLTASALAGTFGAAAGIAVAGCTGNQANADSCLPKGDIATTGYLPQFQILPLVELNRDGWCPDTDIFCTLANPTRRPYIGDLENGSFGAPTAENAQANCYVPRPVPVPAFGELGYLATCGGEGFGWMPRVTGGNALSEYLTPHQEALLGCGPFFGTHCDLQGMDLMNTDASVLLQSFIGFDGTACQPGDEFCWQTGAAEWDPVAQEIVAVPLPDLANRRPQPGTLNFLTGEEGIAPGPNQILGGPVGTRYDRVTRRASVLPGAARSQIPDGSPGVTLNPNWNPRIDGCSLLWSDIPAGVGDIGGLSYQQYCEKSTTFVRNDPSRTILDGSQDLTHPFALDENGNPQKFASELAAISWNLMAILVTNDADFDPQERYTPGQCSYVTPSYCSGLRTFLGIAGLTRNVVKAGGNGRFGRRTFAWQGGGEVTLAYLKRNVLGFSMDFAEDVTKSNWAFEFSWINKVRLADSNSFSGNRDVQDFNLSISVDRPTFIRFLNSSRTFFMNLQMFMQYRDGYRKSMPSDGPFNFLFTFAVQTGYMQDRLLPSFAFVYDVNSQSGAAIPQVTYRVTSNFSLGFGVAFFWGAPSWNAMPLSNLLLGNRGGDRPYENATYNGLGIIRKRDEVFFRLRYTF